MSKYKKEKGINLRKNRSPESNKRDLENQRIRRQLKRNNHEQKR